MKNKMNEDELCVRRFLRGEEKGFETLVHKYRERALNIVYSIIPRERDSEDIVQESFVRVYRNLASFKFRSRFSTWFFRIVVNTTYDFVRRRRDFISLGDLPELRTVSATDPRLLLQEKERSEFINRALLRVPLKFRTALVLKDLEDLSYKEISQVLRCRIGTVESRIYRARRLLADALKRSGGI